MSTDRNISYDNIVQQFRNAASASLSVATFDTGTIDFLDANAVNKNYPYVYLRPVSSPGVVDGVRTLTFELYSMDVPKLSDQSPVQVLSETEQYIYQTMAWFNRGDLQQTYEVTMTDLSPVNEAFQDRVFGWVASIEVITPYNWNFCDYPQIWPTATPVPTATVVPTQTPVPTSTATPTATPIPGAPTATPVPTNTATPTPTASPTATPLPTLNPTPTPSPTPAPVYFEFKINGLNQSGSLSDACNTITGSFESVYVDWNDSDPAWPDRIVGKSVYSDPNLTAIYTASAVIDDSVYRVAYGSESAASVPSYASIDLRWYNFTGSNIVDTLVPCALPTVDTLPDTPIDYTSSLMTGQVDSFGTRVFKDFGFQFGSGSTLNEVEQNAVTSSYPSTVQWTSSLVLPKFAQHYYRAWAQDNETDVFYYGDIEPIRPQLPYSREITVNGIWKAETFDQDREHRMLQAPYVPSQSLWITEQCENGQIEPMNFLNSYLWADSDLTLLYTGSIGAAPGANDVRTQYQYTTGSVTESGYLQVSNISPTATNEYVIDRWMPNNTIQSSIPLYSQIAFTGDTSVTYGAGYRGDRKEDVCTPISRRPDSSSLQANETWGWLWTADFGTIRATKELACNDVTDFDGSEYYAKFGAMTANVTNFNNPGPGLVSKQAFLSDSPYAPPTVYSVGAGTTETFTLGWSGSFAPSGSAAHPKYPDTIYKIRFSEVTGQPNTQKNAEVIETWSVGNVCP
tara:strand:+ start:835 stop:3051 length:2217 start_codon:yes stop_codon:yes gene_type:complete